VFPIALSRRHGESGGTEDKEAFYFLPVSGLVDWHMMTGHLQAKGKMSFSHKEIYQLSNVGDIKSRTVPISSVPTTEEQTNRRMEGEKKRDTKTTLSTIHSRTHLHL
jgi:hypothetical protein